MNRILCLVLVLLLAGCNREPAADATAPPNTPATASEAQTAMPPPALTVRVATFNTSLYNDTDGGLIARLRAGDDSAQRIAAVIQHLRPDILLVNEFDYDAGEAAAELFQRNYLEVPQHGQAPLRYDYRYSAPVNTGVPSGLDLDGDGASDTPNDAWGFGKHPGQYGMLVLSRYRIDAAAVRSFRNLRWASMPDARRPMNADGTPFHPDAIWAQLRLSSKSHWDVPIHTPAGVLHLLAAHPTPPVFDGPEDRNGTRNADEIRLFAEYISGGDAPWLCDDAGRCGGLPADARFVIAGDMNADPADGDGRSDAIAQLLDHPRVLATPVPRSKGATVRAAQYGLPRNGNVATHTGDYGPRVGTLRLDYVLPSTGFHVRDSGVFWPQGDAVQEDWLTASDHRAVWLDLDVVGSGVAPAGE